PALAVDRYATRIDTHVVANGEGTDLKTMTVTAHGEVADATVLGGRIQQLTFDANFAGDTLKAKAAGSFTGFNPATISGREAATGVVAGELDGEAVVANVSLGVTAESVEGTARMTLEPSNIGELQITRASVDAD